MSALADELREVLNRHSAENGSDTPDFILAGYVEGCLTMFDLAVRAREEWYGRKPGPVPDPPPAPPRARATPGMHDARDPRRVAAAFPGTRLTREFLPGVLTSPGTLVQRVQRLLSPSWDAGLTPVWSMKLDRAQVLASKWDRWVLELADWLEGQPDNELVLWHEPENDASMQGGAFPIYFNYLAGLIRTRTTRVPLVYASMAYQWLPNGPGTGSIKGNTDRPGHWQGVRADRFATDVYSGSSVLLDTILPEHRGIARWLDAVVPAGDSWAVAERGWLRPAGTTMTTAEHQGRALSMRREVEWLTGTDEGARVEQVILWNTPGTEGNPNLVLDETYGVPAARHYIATLAG